MNQIRFIAATCCIISFTVSYSQIPPGEKYDCRFVNLDKKSEAAVKVPFASIAVIDARPDSSKAGYYYPGRNDNWVRKICFDAGAKDEVLSFFNSYLQFNNEANLSLLACIKKLWFGTYDTTNAKENKLTIRTRKLLLKMEIYVNDKNCFYPLYRFDSTLNVDDLPKSDPSYVLEFALQKSIRKLVTGTYSNYQKLRCLSAIQIDSFNNAGRRYPILNEAVARKGVYMNITQFQNNNPAYTAFDLKFARSEDIITVKGSGTEDSTVKAWGVCDGKKMYIRMGNNYFPLMKSGSNYDFYGFDTFFDGPTIHPYTTMLGVAFLNLITTRIPRLKPFQLNLATGEVY